MSDEYPQESELLASYLQNSLDGQEERFIQRILILTGRRQKIGEVTAYVNNTDLKFEMKEASRLGNEVWRANAKVEKAQPGEEHRKAKELLKNAMMAKETAQDALTTTRKSILTFYDIPVGGGTKRKRKRRKRKRRKTKRKKTKRRR